MIATGTALMYMFFEIVSLGSLYLAYSRNSFLFALMSSAMLISMMIWGAWLPFQTDVNGNIVPTSENIMLIGFNMMFFTLSLFKTV